MRLLKLLFFIFAFTPYWLHATESALQININTANASQLKQALSGIGDKKAQAIVEYRNAHGAFNSVYDLMLVNGIGKKTVEKNLDRIILSDQSTDSAESTSDQSVAESAPKPADTVESIPEIQNNVDSSESAPPGVQIQNETSQQIESVKDLEQADIEPDFSDTEISPQSLQSVETDVKKSK